MPAHDIRINFDTDTLGRLQVAGLVMRDTAPFYGSAVDAVEPTVAVVSPAEGTDITPDTALVVDVEDENQIAGVTLFVHFPGFPYHEVVYGAGAFRSPYTGAGAVPASTLVELVPNRHFRFTLRRVGGWPGAPSLYVDPVDRGGNLIPP